MLEEKWKYSQCLLIKLIWLTFFLETKKKKFRRLYSINWVEVNMTQTINQCIETILLKIMIQSQITWYIAVPLTNTPRRLKTLRDSSSKNHNLLTLVSFQICMSSFTLKIKEDILKNADSQTVNGTHWLPYYFLPYYGSQKGPTTVWFFKILQNILCCALHKKETNTGLERHEGE